MAFKSSGGASSSSSRPWCKYDAFVSFRGEDTRKNFTDHLSTALDQKGIITFRDDQKLERGKSISPELLKAIEESRFSIIVFSRNYATSSWCLDELAKIVECMKEIGQTVVPIFYDVNRNEVGNQSGGFGEAFDKHEEDYEAEKVEKWRAALTEVANLPGWDLQDRHEATVIQEIVEEIWTKLGRKFSSSTLAKDLVGIDSRLQKLNSCLGIGSKDVRIIGICGMGGIGKTTLARLVYDRVSYQFEGSSFVANIREVSEKFGIATLQELLFSQALVEKNINKWDVHKGIFWNRLRNKRCFIVLDDVDSLEQLETLAGQHEWFAPGSRIIVTARDEHLLIAYGVDVIYKAESLNGEESLQLFSLKAFKQNHPKENYVELTKNIVSYATGLPLALVVLGSSLRRRSVNEWENALKTLRETPNMDIIDILKISYDGLEETEKSIFLDVSCFYIFKDVDRVIEQLKACDLYPEIGLSILIDKSLVSIDNNRPYVHSLLQEMARTIVRQQSPKEPGRRSRLWFYDDIFHVLTNKTGTEATEVIYRNPYESKVIYVDADAFLRMNNLRLLKIHDVHLPKGLDSLPNELRVLKWYGYPQKSLPSSFKAEKLNELDMPHSGIELLWNGVVHLDKLKIIKLSHSHKLTRTPDFSGVPNLERLILEGCKNLYQVHPSLGDLKRLTLLNLKDCINLQSLPKISGWRSLKVLLILGCSKIDKLPENLGDFEYLEELDAGQTAITEAPPSIVHLKNLKKLSFRGCKGQTRRPWNWFRSLLPMAAPSSSMKFSLPPLVGLLSLKELDLSDCNLSEGVLPSDLGQLSALKKLNLSKNDFISLPASINQLSKLQTLELADCKNLQALPELPASIEDLRTYNCSSLKTLAGPLGLSTSKSREFSLNNCFRLGDNQGDNNVALSLLKHHIFLLVKMRMLSIFSMFMNFVENQGNNSELAMMTSLVRILMHILLQGLSNSPSEMPRLVIFLSGSEIPDWFMFQTTSCSLNIELPTNWYNDYSFLGLAICATFEVQDQHGQDQTKDLQRLPVPTLFRVKNASNYDYKLKFYLLSDEGDFIIFGKEYYLNRDTLALKNHLWLLFLPFDQYFQKKNWRRVEAYIRVEGPGFEFKKCGIRFVHLQDELGELSRAMLQGFSESQLQVLTMQLSNMLSPGEALSRPATEQSHEAQQYCENDKAGPSGIGSFPDHDQAEANDEVEAGGSGSYDEETQGAELREAIDPMVELKGKRIQE